MKYTHLFFDLDNTLWDFKKNAYHALRIAFHHFAVQEQLADYELFFKAFSRYSEELWEDYRRQRLIKKELKRIRFQKTFDEFNIRGIDPLEMNEFYFGEIPNQNRLVDGAFDLLQYLRSKGYLLFVITNGFRELQLKKLENSGLEKYFIKIFTSEDIKSPKPGKKIFEYAVKSANARKINSLMIGDDWEVDVEGALDFGIDAVYFCNDGNNKSSNKLKVPAKNKVFYINELSELMCLL